MPPILTLSNNKKKNWNGGLLVLTEKHCCICILCYDKCTYEFA